MRLVVRHILPVGLSSLALVGLWVIVTIPIAAVFLIDGDFVLSEYAQFLAYAFGVSFGLSAVILFPIAALGEALSKLTKHAIWAIPLGLWDVSLFILVCQTIVLDSLQDALVNWGGLAVLISGLFVLYWVILWFEKAALFGWSKLRENQR